MATGGKGITETLIEGLRLVRQSGAYRKAMALKGKIELDGDGVFATDAGRIA